jgi:hypothetical protein
MLFTRRAPSFLPHPLTRSHLPHRPHLVRSAHAALHADPSIAISAFTLPPRDEMGLPD